MICLICFDLLLDLLFHLLFDLLFYLFLDLLYDLLFDVLHDLSYNFMFEKSVPVVVVVYLMTNQRHMGYLSSGNGHLAGRYSTP